MKKFPIHTKFMFPWRKYQKRVLDELDFHLKDDHLHIIAPPGSGKTILGLEVAIRLNQPTLILAPTIAIRNQWIKRLCDLLCELVFTRNLEGRKLLLRSRLHSLSSEFEAPIDRVNKWR